MKVFLVLETEQTGATITISDLMSTSQYLVLQLESSTTINFAWQKKGGHGPHGPPGLWFDQVTTQNVKLTLWVGGLV